MHELDRKNNINEEKEISITIQKPFMVNLVDDKLIIKFIKNFRSDSWGAWFGEIQKVIRDKLYEGSSFNSLDIDLSRCIWADPLPLLSLIISLREFRVNNGKVSIILPSIRINDGSTISRTRFLQFLSQEGFLKAFLIEAKGKVFVDNREIDGAFFNKLKQTNIDLSFLNYPILTAEVLDLRKINDIRDFFQKKIETIIFPTIIPIWSQEDLKSRLYAFLVETLDNIKIHAYDIENFNNSFAGIYIRFREGLDNKEINYKSLDQKRILKYAITEESKHNPRLIKEFLEDSPGAIEVFVIDSGVGLCETFSNKKDKNKLPFVNSFRLIFINGERRKDLSWTNKTETGGLHFLGNLFSKNKDYLLGRDDNSWVGTFFPITSPETANIHKLDLAKEHCGESINGLAWLGRLTWSEETLKEEKYLFSWKGEPNKNPFYKSLEKNNINPKRFDNYFFEDCRFKNKVSYFEDTKKINSKTDYFFLLPAERVTRSQVRRKIEKIADRIKYMSGKTIIIADIAIEDINTYISFLNESKFFNDSKTNIGVFNKIILISRRMAISVYIKVEKTKTFQYVFNIRSTKSMYQSVWYNSFSPHKSIIDIILWLKRHDSMIFWNCISNHYNANSLFINSLIKWGDNEKINGFLNFIQTYSIPICNKLYKLALERISGLFKERRCHYNDIDILTSRLCLNLNINLFPHYKGKNIINVGNIFVKGYKLRKDHKNNIKNLDIYFFKHPDSTRNVATLFFWPNQKWINIKFQKDLRNFERVGKTPIIAEEGPSFFKLPRMNNDGKTCYIRNPEESYFDFQKAKPTLMHFGHYAYGDYHDLIFPNTANELENSFLKMGNLALFLLSEFFYSLGGKDEDDLSKIGEKWWDRLKEKKTKLHQREVCLIAYPSHYNTDIAISKIKECLSEKLNKKIISLVTINSNREGSSKLISPLIFEEVKNRIKDFKDKHKSKATAILFDVTIVSGRTSDELKHILTFLGVEDIRTLSIFDRQRLPFKIPDPLKHLSYWRLDLPRMGINDTCPLCLALRNINNFKESLISKTAIKRIENWNKVWGKTSRPSTFPEHLRNTYVKLNKPKMNFGIEATINTSTGLVLYTSEINSMTSRNDFVLKLCKEERLSDIVKIELISAQILLFGQEFSRTLHKDYLKMLIKCSINIEGHDNYSSLAALVLIIQDGFYIENIINELTIEEAFNQNIIKNDDIKIALAYHAYYNNILRDRYKYDNILRLLKGSTDLKDLYWSLHFEICNSFGQYHGKPIPYLLSDNIDSIPENLKVTKILDVLDSIDQLVFILEEIPNYNFKLNEIDEVSIKDIKNELFKNLKNCSSYIIKKLLIIRREISEKTKINKNISDIIDIIKPAYNLLKNMHSLLFMSSGRSSLYHGKALPFEKEIRRIVNEIISEHFKSEDKKTIEVVKCLGFKISESIVDSWFYWDKRIVEEFKYLVINVKHSSGLITDCFYNNKDKSADMWIGFDFEPKYVEIILKNRSKDPASIIKTKREKKKWQQEHIEYLGGSINYYDEKFKDEYLISTSLKLPYITFSE